MKTSTILAALGFVLGANAACFNATRSASGKLTAHCYDELTNVEFEYEDLDGHVEEELGAADAAISMYESYLAGVSNVTSVGLQKRGFTEYWKFCADKISGACSNDHVIQWTGSGAALISAGAAVFSSIDSKSVLDGKPRSKCTHFKNNGTVCVSWAAYYVSTMSQEQIQAISSHCEQECGKSSLSCEVRIITDATTEYYCESNRATGCTSSNSISSC